MDRTVSSRVCLGNGDTHPSVATHCMDVLDAAYHTANQYPGGARALAVRLQTRDRIDGTSVPMNPNTFTHKVNPRCFSHSVNLEEARDMMVMSGDHRILYALAAITGHVAIKVEVEHGGVTMERVGQMAKEFSDLLSATTHAEQATSERGSRITPNEMASIEREAAELIAAVNSLVGNLRAKAEAR